MTQDPVCGMDVQPEQAAGQSEYQGRTALMNNLPG
jgi:YHS domain-containing protein